MAAGTPAAQAAVHPLVRLVPKPDSAVKQPRQRSAGPLGSFAPASRSAMQRAEGTAVAAAAREGHPVAVAGLQTESEIVTAAGDGLLTARSYVTPVQVERAGRWVRVDTDLRRQDGMLAAPVLPGDSVQLSAGGSGPMATIGSGSSSLSLWWPRRLPRPAVSSSTATYRNALPGVTLVLTAENGTAGAFSESLVVASAKAARQVRSLRLRVTGPGARLAAVPGGGLAARAGRGGVFTVSAPAMWDSGVSARGLTARKAEIGAVVRPAGEVASGGVAVSSVQGPGRDALLAPVAEQAGSGWVRLTPDARMLTSPATSFPVDIAAGVYSMDLARAGASPALAARAADATAATTTTSLSTEADSGGMQAYDPVQSTCTSSHYNSSSYYDSPVGYDDWGGSCAVDDTDYALYRVGVPSALNASGVTLATATVNAAIAYTSSCSDSPDVSLTWTGTINSGTGWSGPKAVSGQTNVDVTFPPDDNGGSGAEDTWSCNGYEQSDDGLLDWKGFNVKSDISQMLSASNFTFRLSETQSDEESGATDADYYHAQFANGKHDSDGPYLQVQFFDKPATVSTSTMEEATSTADNPTYSCATTEASAQALVPTSAGGGVQVGAIHTDPDGTSILGASIRYFLASDPSDYVQDNDVPDDSPGTSHVYGREWEAIPYSWLSAEPNGSVIGWVTDSFTGKATVSGTTYGPIYTPSYSATCYFDDYWDIPEAPGVTANFTQSQAQSVDNSISFAITPSPDDATAASEYVYSLDQEPPTSGTIPDSELCTTSSATTPDCVIGATGDATLDLTVTSPGPHTLYVYEIDSKAVQSGETTAGLPDSSTDCQNDDVAGCAWGGYTFTGAADSPVSYTTGSSLQANFDLAMDSGYATNTLISATAGTACPAAHDGDGGGDNFYAPQLTSAGWDSGGDVTVDGATFTLPSFGSCGADNLLAANQTIGTGGTGTSASALVFLATSTTSATSVPGLMTGDPNAGTLLTDVTAPAVMGGTPVSGSGCLDSGGFGDPGCVPSTGTINYAAGCAAAGGQTSVPYDLTVPDWVTGPSDIQAISTADRVNSAGEQADAPKIYAFSVPLYADCTVTSVTLPDVGATVYAATPSGSGVDVPALHIFGLSLRNTTTATPEVSGTAAAAPSGQGWTGAMESPVQLAAGPPAGQTWGDNTFRETVVSTVAGAAGSQLRIQLTDPGFLSADGDQPLQIGAATIATSYLGAPGETPVALTFGGSGSVTVPDGGSVYSDPVALGSSTFTVTAGEQLLVSLWITNASLPVLPVNLWSSGAVTTWAPASTPNETASMSSAPFTEWSGVTALLSAVDITTPAETQTSALTLASVTSPGAPTVVVAGDNVIDGLGTDALGDSLDSPSQRLAGQLYSQGLATGYGVVDAGMSANQVMADGGGAVSLLARLDRDVLAEPDVGTVVIDEGLQDLLSSAQSETALDTAYAVLINDLDAYGINVIVTTMTPCDGYDSDGHSCTATAVDPTRSLVNEDITGGNVGLPTPQPFCAADVDSIVSNGGSPEALAASPTDYDSGDHANLSWDGYAAMAGAFNMNDAQYGPCALSPDGYPLPG